MAEATPRLRLDTVEGASLDYDRTKRRRVRTGLVSGMPLPASSPDPLLLEAVMEVDGMPAFGDAYPDYNNLILNRVRVQPINNSMLRVFLIYETPSFGFGFNSFFIVRTNSYLGTIQSDRIPGTSTILGLSWTNPTDSDQKVPWDHLVMNFDMTLKEITVSQLLIGSVPEDEEDYTGYVNAETWQGRPPGYWKLTRYETTESRYSGYYVRELAVLTKNIEDWSQTGTLRHQQTGRHVKLDQTELNDMMNLPYSYGPIGIINGAMRVGAHPMTPFAPIFGFNNSSSGFWNRTS